MISKSTILRFIPFFILSSSASLSQADVGIVGEWSGTDSDGDTASFIFNADNSAEVKFEGVPRLSTHTMTNGEVSWCSDSTPDPIHVDIIIVRDSTEVSRIRMVAQLIDDGTLKLQISRDMVTRPKGFKMNDKVFQLLATRQ